MATKYVIIIPDGAADEPQESLGGKTPLQAANIPAMDQVASTGILGRSSNVPARFLPASDVATLSLCGYDPEVYFTGRAPLEAAAMGHKLGPFDWAIRCNLMTINDGLMTDFTAGHISTEEAREVMADLHEHLKRPNIEFHPGVQYRNLMIYRGTADSPAPFDQTTLTTPPHDVPDRPAGDYLPKGAGGELLAGLMREGSPILADHPMNKQRIAAGKRPASAMWLWGQGVAPSLKSFEELYGIKGAIISAVDLVRGVGMLAGWTRIDVPGATGYLDTDYAAKGRYGIKALENHDLVCVHVEAPDEASHEGRTDAKIEAIERMDRDIVAPIHQALKEHGDYRILITPDHSTMLRTRAHDRAPVPWAMAGRGLGPSGLTYDEISAKQAGVPFLEQGYRLMEQFLISRG